MSSDAPSFAETLNHQLKAASLIALFQSPQEAVDHAADFCDLSDQGGGDWGWHRIDIASGHKMIFELVS